MTTASSLALRRLADVLPDGDALNLGYCLLIEGELDRRALERAIHRVLVSDPSLRCESPWREGRVGHDRFAVLAAEHLATPLDFSRPFNAALWSCDERTHLFLLAIYHLVADGVVLDRIGRDLSRSLQGQVIEAVPATEQRWLPGPAEVVGSRLPLPDAPPSMRASCRTIQLSDEHAQAFRSLVRSWRTTPFAAVVTCVSAVIAGWSESSNVSVSVQVANRTSREAQRAPGPWYDHIDLSVSVPDDEPLRALLLEVTHRIADGLAITGVWNSGQTGPHPELLVVYDRYPLTSFKMPGCRVHPLGVRRHPCRADGVQEHLVATDADVVVFFREQSEAISFSLFTKMARIPENTAAWLFTAILDAFRSLCEEAENPLDLADAPPFESITSSSPAVWPEPALCDLPLIDAVSPVFRVRPESLEAFGQDARQTLDMWGKPPWF